MIEIFNVQIIHPTNNADIDVKLPENILLKDVFSQLIEADFLTGGQPYSGILRPRDNFSESKPLDNEKTIGENGVENNTTIQIMMSTKSGGSWEYVVQLSLGMRFSV